MRLIRAAKRLVINKKYKLNKERWLKMRLEGKDKKLKTFFAQD